MIPATSVPWPLSSWPVPLQSRGLPPDPTQSVLAAIRPARSWWARSTPVSTTPTGTPAPVLVDHAAGAPIIARPHCLANSGSLGVVDGAAPAGADAATAAITAQDGGRGTETERQRGAGGGGKTATPCQAL